MTEPLESLEAVVPPANAPPPDRWEQSVLQMMTQHGRLLNELVKNVAKLNDAVVGNIDGKPGIFEQLRDHLERLIRLETSRFWWADKAAVLAIALACSGIGALVGAVVKVRIR